MADDIPADAVELTEVDLEALVAKLDVWSDTLSPAERGLLQLLVARAEAGAADGEVSGFGLTGLRGAPVAGTIATPAGLPSIGLTVSSILGPALGGQSIFMDPRAGTWSSWGRR